MGLRHRPAGARPGLTLAEVLIALVLTAMVVMASWRFFGSASESMSVFTGTSLADERLTLASDLLASDVRRAGMFGTPFSQADPLACPKPARQLRAVVVEDGGSLPAFDFGTNVFVDPDQIVLLSPVLADLVNPQSITANTVTFALGDPEIPSTQAEFNRTFTDRTLRITSPSGFGQFVEVTAVNFAGRSVTVAPAPMTLDANGYCGIEGVGGADHEIAVLTLIRYQLIPDPDDPTERTLLVREELDPTATTVLDGTRLVVAENVVDLQFWGDEDSGVGLAGAAFTPDTALGDDQGTATLDALSTRTQRLRILHFAMAARTDREFGMYSLQPKLGGADLLSTWEVNATSPGVALVLNAGRAVEVSSLVVRRLQ